MAAWSSRQMMSSAIASIEQSSSQNEAPWLRRSGISTSRDVLSRRASEPKLEEEPSKPWMRTSGGWDELALAASTRRWCTCSPRRWMEPARHTACSDERRSGRIARCRGRAKGCRRERESRNEFFSSLGVLDGRLAGPLVSRPRPSPLAQSRSRRRPRPRPRPPTSSVNLTEPRLPPFQTIFDYYK
eukprot:scaffold33704_cov27-Tisochrysis_lutea.AAC.3